VKPSLSSSLYIILDLSSGSKLLTSFMIFFIFSSTEIGMLD